MQTFIIMIAFNAYTLNRFQQYKYICINLIYIYVRNSIFLKETTKKNNADVVLNALQISNC